jgi:phosphate transport system substrate-binding protein
MVTNTTEAGKIIKLFTFEGIVRKEVPNVSSGDIVMLAGLPNIYIGDTITDNADTAALPAIKIEVLGPPPTSGTRDAFAELGLEAGAASFPSLKDLKAKDKKAFEAVAFGIREDGAYIEVGENDVLIVRKLEENKNALGIFGYSYLEQNSDKIQGVTVDGAQPTYENIAAGKYVLSRPLFFYVKDAHVGVVPGLKEYTDLFVKMTVEDGPLSDKGLVTLPESARATMVRPVK